MPIRLYEDVLLVVDQGGNILFPDTKSISLNNFGKAKNIADLNFEPQLSSILEKYKSSGTNNSIHKIKQIVVCKNENKKYEVIIKEIAGGDSQHYSIEIQPTLTANDFHLDENEFQTSMNANNQFFIVTNGSGTIVYCTDVVNQTFHNRIKILKGKRLIEVIDKYMQPVEKENIKASLFDGRAWQVDIHIKEKKEKLISLNSIPVYDDAEHVKNFLVFGKDVTNIFKERTAYERVIKLTKTVIDNIPGLVAVFRDRDDTIVLGEANEKFLETFMLQRSSVIDRDINAIFQTGFLNLLHQVMDKSFVKNAAYFEYRNEENSSISYGGKIVCIKDLTERGEFYILNMRDMTNILEYEKQLKSDFEKETYLSKLKSSFLVNMALEIRTPFNSIMAYSDLIDQYIDEGDNNSVKELLDSTKQILKRVFKLFNNVTEVAQIESGDVHLKNDILNCNEVVRIAYVKMKEEVLQKNLEFEFEAYSESLIIKADWAKIEHIIILLLENSIKYSSKGKITLGTDKRDDNAVITILDTGKGISEEDLIKLTEAFNVQEDEVGSLQGAGLGLTIVYNYTKLMGGSFNIQSQSKKGTRITLSFPLYSG